MNIAMWFYCCLWFDNNAPIASFIRFFMDENTSVLKILYLFLDTFQRDTQSICHFFTGYHWVWYNHINDTLSRPTNRFIEILFYRVPFEGTFFVYRVLFHRTFFVYRVLFEGTIYPVGDFLYRYPSVLSPIQIIECGIERNCLRLILWFFAW